MQRRTSVWCRLPDRLFVVSATLALGLLLTGCSSFNLLYERLDWYVNWRVAKYVSLRPEQKVQLDREFAGVWRWHRQHELPLYAGGLRGAATLLEAPVSPDQVAEYLARSQERWQALATQALPGLCGLLATLDDDQAAQILRRIDRDDAEFYDKFVEPSEKRRRREVERRQRKWIERWIGDLNERQDALLRHWTRERDDLAAPWFGFRRQWRTEFAGVLDQRGATEACARLEPLVLRPMALLSDDLKRRGEDNQRRWQQLIADLLAAMDETQQEFARRKLHNTAAELEQLVQTSA